jgi:hypothetical protein
MEHKNTEDIKSVSNLTPADVLLEILLYVDRGAALPTPPTNNNLIVLNIIHGLIA